MRAERESGNEEGEDPKEQGGKHGPDQGDYRSQWKGCSKQNDSMSKSSLSSQTKPGERPFKCSKCSKDFTRADALGKHIKRHEASGKIAQEAVDRIFYLAEQRDIECLRTLELLGERQFVINCERLLHECLLSEEEDRGWERYL